MGRLGACAELVPRVAPAGVAPCRLVGCGGDSQHANRGIRDELRYVVVHESVNGKRKVEEDMHPSPCESGDGGAVDSWLVRSGHIAVKRCASPVLK